MRLNINAAEIAMAERGFNKIDLAREVGISKQALYKYLNGGSCRPKMAKRLADALETPVRELFGCESGVENGI